MKTNNLVRVLACIVLLSAVPQQELLANEDAGALAALLAVVDRWQPVLDGGFGALAVAADAGAAVQALGTLHGYGLAIHAEAAALRRAWPRLRRMLLIPAFGPFFTRVAPFVGRYTTILDATSKRFASNPGVTAALARVRGLAGR